MVRRLGFAAAGVVALSLCVACASVGPRSDGIVHSLRPGETLYELARHYGVPVERIIAANEIRDVTKLQIGQEIWIPGTQKSTPREALAARGAGSDWSRRANAKQAVEASALGLEWPVRGQLSSRFGWRNGQRHDGIDIPAERGTPIHAAQAGKVIHSGGGLGDYGKVVIVKHEGHFSTVYAHNHRVRVRKGEFIEQGEVVGEVGSTGNASGAHVHFELRRNRKPVDPMLYLP